MRVDSVLLLANMASFWFTVTLAAINIKSGNYGWAILYVGASVFCVVSICLLRATMKWMLYRLIMKIVHRYNWHYAPPCYPDGDTQLWCRWCGFRQTVNKTDNPELTKPTAGVVETGGGDK